LLAILIQVLTDTAGVVMTISTSMYVTSAALAVTVEQNMGHATSSSSNLLKRTSSKTSSDASLFEKRGRERKHVFVSAPRSLGKQSRRAQHCRLTQLINSVTVCWCDKQYVADYCTFHFLDT
jgi:hypothetical protein